MNLRNVHLQKQFKQQVLKGTLALAILLTASVCLPALAAEETAWQQLPDMPVGKWEPASVMVDDKLYLFGGYKKNKPSVKSTKSVFVFDPKDTSWSQLQDMPSSLTHFNLVLDGRKIWYAGGFKDGYKGHAIAEVWNYDLDLDRFTAAPLLPEVRGGGGLALIGRNLHFISGITVDRLTDAVDHWVLDLDAWEKGDAQWENLAPIPVGRNQFSMMALEGKIYAIGGQFGHDAGQIDQARVDIYDPKTDTWSEGPPLPKGHSHAEGSTFVHDGRIYMAGGHTTPEGGRKEIDPDILALAPGGQWELVGKLPHPLSSPAAAIIQGKFYLAGGYNNEGIVQEKVFMRDAP
jgi:N-acetylneuraminic acid mutarotase